MKLQPGNYIVRWLALQSRTWSAPYKKITFTFTNKNVINEFSPLTLPSPKKIATSKLRINRERYILTQNESEQNHLRCDIPPTSHANSTPLTTIKKSLSLSIIQANKNSNLFRNYVFCICLLYDRKYFWGIINARLVMKIQEGCNCVYFRKIWCMLLIGRKLLKYPSVTIFSVCGTSLSKKMTQLT